MLYPLSYEGEKRRAIWRVIGSETLLLRVLGYLLARDGAAAKGDGRLQAGAFREVVSFERWAQESPLKLMWRASISGASAPRSSAPGRWEYGASLYMNRA